jgi:hypothetical protein
MIDGDIHIGMYMSVIRVKHLICTSDVCSMLSVITDLQCFIEI